MSFTIHRSICTGCCKISCFIIHIEVCLMYKRDTLLLPSLFFFFSLLLCCIRQVFLWCAFFSREKQARRPAFLLSSRNTKRNFKCIAFSSKSVTEDKFRIQLWFQKRLYTYTAGRRCLETMYIAAYFHKMMALVLITFQNRKIFIKHNSDTHTQTVTSKNKFCFFLFSARHPPYLVMPITVTTPFSVNGNRYVGLASGIEM